MSDKLMKTLIARPGAGYSYYFGMIDGLLPSFQADSLTTPLLLISEKITIDSNWDESVPGSVLRSIVEKLMDLDLIEEIDLYEKANKNHTDKLLKYGLVKFMEWWALVNDFKLNETIKDHAQNDPYEFLNHLRGGLDMGRGHESIPYDYFRQLLDALFHYSCIGTVCERIHDPYGLLQPYYAISKLNKEPSLIDGTSEVDWVMGICSEQLPYAPIVLDKEGNKTDATAAWVDLGFKLEGNNNPDENQTIKQLERILKLRESSEVKDLRGLYKEAIERSTIEQIWGTFDKTRSEFHKQWSHVRAQYRRNLKTSNTLDKWTDVLTIPAGIASLAFPIAGAVPVATWLGAKFTKHKADNKTLDISPWLMAAEQMGEIGLMIQEEFEK